jgi:hypothetical protein
MLKGATPKELVAHLRKVKVRLNTKYLEVLKSKCIGKEYISFVLIGPILHEHHPSLTIILYMAVT